MSYTITTDVFCDYCHDWMSEGGISGTKIEKKKAWGKAHYFGWEKKRGKFKCPKCVRKKKGGG